MLIKWSPLTLVNYGGQESTADLTPFIANHTTPQIACFVENCGIPLKEYSGLFYPLASHVLIFYLHC
jgi:hypothetical protein